MSEQRALTTTQVAERLQVSEPTVRQLVREGKLAAVRVGRLLRFAPDAVDRFLSGGP